MSSVADALASCEAWGEPRPVEGNPFRLACRVAPPASDDEINAAWGSAAQEVLVDLWHNAREAHLFTDVDYGQWGLHLLPPAESASRSVRLREERPDEVRKDDVVVGEFLGDQELLVLDGTGAPLIALPLDPREAWSRPAAGLPEFLCRFVAAKGEKYWESRSAGA